MNRKQILTGEQLSLASGRLNQNRGPLFAFREQPHFLVVDQAGVLDPDAFNVFQVPRSFMGLAMYWEILTTYR